MASSKFMREADALFARASYTKTYLHTCMHAYMNFKGTATTIATSKTVELRPECKQKYELGAREHATGGQYTSRQHAHTNTAHGLPFAMDLSRDTTADQGGIVH